MHRLLKNAYSFLSVWERRSLSFCTTRPILLFFVSITVCFPLAYIPLGAVFSRHLEYMASAPLPLPWMTQRLAGVLIRVLNLIGKTSIFSKSSQLHCVAPDESTETGRQQKESFTKPKWKIYDFTMFLSRITASHGIAVDWSLRVYWLLPLSTVDSCKKHRRFFRRAPTTLLLSTINTWANQSTSFPKGVISCFHRTLFLFINYSYKPTLEL